MKFSIASSVALVACVAGCSSLQTVSNENASEIVKAKHAGAYREVLLLPPKDDSRKVAPIVAKEMEQLGLKVRVLDPSKPVEAAQGTGFVIDASGLLLTCAHVVGDQKVATVSFGTTRLIADVVETDAKVDLALLKLREPLPADASVLRFRSPASEVALGEEVATLGYPLSRILGNGVRMSRGIVSAQTGLRDDAGQVQVSAEVQPGNSGGPLLDRDGHVVGVVSATLNSSAVSRATGAQPQNVNFAVKSQPVVDFLATHDKRLGESVVGAQRSSGLVGLEKGVAKIQAGTVGPDSDRKDKVLVVIAYQSFWDVWYRFRYFVLTAADYETQEALFAIGQTRDTLITNEDTVIHATVLKLKEGLDKR